MATHPLLKASLILTASTWMVPPATSQGGGALALHLPENATYHYVNATASTTIPSVPPTWFLPSFDDSGWFVGQGAFGSGFGGDMANAFGSDTPNAPQYPGSTAWSVEADPFLRTTFAVPTSRPLTVWIAVDNGIQQLYLNGLKTTISFNAEGDARRWEHVFDIPASLINPGTNSLALQLEDHGFATGFAMVITDDDVAVHPPFTTETCGIPAGSSEYGSGTPGTLGLPQVRLLDAPILGQAVRIELTNSADSASCGCLVWGHASTSILDPRFELLVTPDHILHVDLARGTSLLTARIPASIELCGTRLYVQLIQIDRGAVRQVSASRGLEVTQGGG